MGKTMKIAMIVPITDDPTSFYRGVGPWTELQREVPELQLFYLQPPISWAQLKGKDLLFMQRPATPDHFNWLCMAKDHGLPVWIDMDDDNLSVPKDNPMYGMYAQVAVKDAIVKLTRSSDVVTVSTEFLKKKYGIYNKNVYLVPNALDEDVLRFRQIPNTPREKMFLWRGTASHGRNLKVIENELIRVAKDNPAWNFTFFGIDPIDLTDNIKNHRVLPTMSIFEFYKMMVNLHATATYYTLNKTDHSLARSHVSWLEATFASSLMIAPKLPEFERPGILNFATPEEFKERLESVVRGDVDIDTHVNESWKCIQENYMLRHVNRLRKQLLEEIMR